MYDSTNLSAWRQCYHHRILKVSALLILYCLNANAGKLPETEEVTLKLGKGIIQAEIANSPETRERGLMQRKQLKPDSGMLFVFDTPQSVCLWMKNTLIPLSAAFIDNQGHIIGTVDLEPNSEELHCAPAPILYILEVNRNWFDLNEVKPVSKIDSLPINP